MSTMPEHLRPITVEIPVTWTAEQALAVWEILDQLREKIWIRYSSQLQDLLAEERRCADVDDSDAGCWTWVRGHWTDVLKHPGLSIGYNGGFADVCLCRGGVGGWV
jgi:hypothetical protein